MSKKVSPEQEQAIVASYKAGDSITSIFVKFEISKRTFYNIIDRTGVDTKRALTTRTPEEEQAIIARYNKGENARAIAASTGSSHQTIYNILERHKVNVKRPVKQSNLIDKKRLTEACSSDCAVYAAIEEFNVSEEVVLGILNRFGISLSR